MRAYESQGAVGEADDVPANPLAQNAATEALKPKARPVPAVGATLDDPNAPQLPGVEASSAAPKVNMDPNAYQPPPQAAEPTVTAPTTLPTTAPVVSAPTPTQTAAPVQASAAPAESQVDLVNRLQAENQAKVTDGGASLASGPLVGTAGMFGNQKADAQGRVAQGGGVEDTLLRMSPQEQYQTFGFTYSQNPKDWGAVGTAGPDGVVRRPDGTVVGNSTPGETVMQDATTGRYLPLSKLKQQGWGQSIDANKPSAFLPQTAPNGVDTPVSALAPALPSPAPAGAQEAAVLKPNIVTTQVGGQNAGAPALPSPAPSGQPATASGIGNVAQTAVTPENALTNAMLSRVPGADRFKIAQDQWDAFTRSTAPQYEADQRAAMRRAAAGGALGSGMLQTTLGDLASNRALALDTQKQNFLSEALKGNIEDQFRDLGVAQQQQGFQQGQQQQAFGNEVTRAQLEEALTNGSFQRALQQLTAGSGGNPADTALLLSQIFGGQASDAGSSLAALLAGIGQKNAAGGTSGGGGSGNANLLSTLFQLAPILFGGGKPSASLPTGQAIGGGSGPTSPFAFTG